MPSADIDGSVVVILGASEARLVYDRFCQIIDLYRLSVTDDVISPEQADYDIVNKIAKALELPTI